jgi:pimeloyl-ACP methyl ester carboxylesterase
MNTGLADVGRGIRLSYEWCGQEHAPVVLLVAGLGVQLNFWPASLCTALERAGLRVIRFDHRDTGLSTKVEDHRGRFAERFAAASRGEHVDLAYTIGDLADDTAGLLGAIGADSAHVVGASMGGSVAQQLAIGRPDMVRSLTSIMASSGEPGYGQPQPAAMRALLTPLRGTRTEIIDQSVALRRSLAAGHFDEAAARAVAGEAYDRCWYPQGVGRQLLAAVSAPDRSAGLRRLTLPTLIVHGDADPLVDVSGGRRVADLVPGARLLVLPGTGHEVAGRDIAVIVQAILDLIADADVG